MAAGLGFKTFTTGEVLTAADTNGYLMQGVLVFASSAARAAAISSPQEGQYSYLKDTNSTEYYDGAAWIAAPIGDITGVTAGTGISGGGTSGTVTITNSMATEITAKGDLIAGTGSATFDNLPVGTNGQTLVADSSTATGLKWAAASAGLAAASQAEMEAASSTTVATTPGRQQYHPSAAKFWVYYTGTGTPTIQVSYGVSSITDNGVGVYTVNLTTAFSTAAYALMGGADKLSGASSNTTLTGSCFSGAYNTNSFLQQVYTLDGTLVDSARVFCVGFGDQ